MIRVLPVGRIHPDMLFLLLCLYLSCPGPVHRGVHGVRVMRGLILWFERVEEFDPSLLLALMLEVDPFCLACQGHLLPFRIVAVTDAVFYCL